ncbi:hypothetical protein M404DRAFT_994082 [Pisolithus tinctorius Marx 270]|uniref:Uncharacterized protein n=1 Tax=Pisolithus tinctorius Marx 270 TaxID=870435 RepID=A0A0C3PSD8_PISTI|nr:hypothetical protein M404DRAFT_994082 [Pisolithus tinctorius Marx 270]
MQSHSPAGSPGCYQACLERAELHSASNARQIHSPLFTAVPPGHLWTDPNCFI